MVYKCRRCVTYLDLAQFGLQHLAVIVFWQHLDEAVIARALEAGDAIEAEGVEFRRCDRGARTLHKKGHNLLTPVWMRPANHRDLS